MGCSGPETAPRSDARVRHPLRIAHVTNELFSVEGANGVQQVVYALAHAQVEAGDAVAVFSKEAGVHILADGVQPRGGGRIGRAGGEPSVRHRFFSGYVRHNLGEHLLSWQPDIVHFHSVHIPQNVILAARVRDAGIPYCVTAHGGLFPPALRRARLKKAVFHLLVERRYLRDARFIHAVSPSETAAIRGHGVRRPIVVVPNGPPPDVDARASDPEALYAAHPFLRQRRVFMFVGRLDPWQKGLDLLLEAFARAGLATAALVLVGPDCRGSRERLAARARRLGIGSEVVFIGPAFGVDRANLLAAADVFVHPSRWEGLSLSVLAAAAAGKPCLITRDADPLGALEPAGGAIIVAPTVSGILDGLKRTAALTSEQLQVMGAGARRARASHSTWASVAATLGDAYLNAIPAGHER